MRCWFIVYVIIADIKAVTITKPVIAIELLAFDVSPM
jgi:hypothetical protein